MRKIISIITLVLCSLTLNAQQKFDIEYYKKVLDTTKNNQLKLETLDSLMNFTRNDETDEYVVFSKQYIDLTEDLELYDQMIKKGVQIYPTMRFNLNKKAEADSLFNRLEASLPKAKDSTVIGSFYLRKGRNTQGLDNEKAITFYSKAIDFLRSKDSVSVADSHLYRGQCYDTTGKYVKAVNDYEVASSYYLAIPDSYYYLATQQNIAIIYSRNGFAKKAKDIRDVLKEKALEIENYEILIGTFVNESVDLGKENKLKAQQELLEKALEENLKNFNNDLIYDNFIRTNLVQVTSKTGQKEAAQKHLDVVEQRKPDFENNMGMLQHYYGAKGFYEMYFGNLNKAATYFEQQIEILNKLNSKESLANTKKILAEVYERLGNKDIAVKYFKEATAIKDSTFNLNKTNSFLFYQTLYETERKEKELIQKTSEVELLEQKNSTKQRVLILSIAGISLLFLIIYLIRNRAYLKKTKQQQEEFSQQLLQSQEEERKRISKDLHDSLGQSLLLIKNKVILNDDKETGSIVNNAIEEVRSISRALHPFQLEELGLTKAIENVVNQLDESTDIFISSEVDNIQNVFKPEQEVNIFRIVQESLNNIIKHANAQAARVEVVKEDKHVQIIIKDNGKGFDFSERYNDFKSLGLKTLKERTKLLNGSMKIDSEKNKGTTLAFTIPLAA